MTENRSSIVIKRYANRKLYDTRASRYITLAQIADLIEAGETVQILDKNSGEDITEMTLAQVFVDARRKRPGSPPIEGLKDVFRTTSAHVKRQLTDEVTNIRQTVGESVNRLLKTGEERANETRDLFQAWIAEQTQVLEDTQRRFDERVKVISSYIEEARKAHEQIEALQRQVNQLATRLSRFENQGRKRSSKDDSLD